jgi:uncharacterized membrane protein YoaK (UPF0700 family)
MLRHLGRRTYLHNLRLASLLGLTAGSVNAEGLLGYKVLTTNVTGHVALFSESLTFENWNLARLIFFYMFLFLLGAFLSSLIMSWADARHKFFSYIPIFIEISILFLSALNGNSLNLSISTSQAFACTLLFAMGLQNALVTVISGSVVRTTHLTGTMTDLGVDLSRMIRGKGTSNPAILLSIKLKVYLIFFFVFGAILGGFLFNRFHFFSFYFPIFILGITLIFDYTRITVKRKFKTMRIRARPRYFKNRIPL